MNYHHGRTASSPQAPDPAQLHFWDRNKWDYWDFNAAARLGTYTPSVAAPSGRQAPGPDNARVQ